MPSYKDDDGRWRYRFAFRGKRYSGSTAKAHNTKGAADVLERRHLEKLEARTFTGRMPTVAEFSAQFLSHQLANTKPLTHDLHKTIVNIHINPSIGTLPIDEVNAGVIARLMATWLETAARRTVNTRTGVLLRMLALGVEWGILPMVPKVKLLKIADEPIRFLSDAEGALLAEAAGKARAHAGVRWRTMVIVGLRTGLRVGELRGLQRSDINLHAGALHVYRTDPGRLHFEANAPKSNRMRTVPLTPDAVTALTEWLELVPDKSPDAWVFPADETWTRNDRVMERSRPLSETACKTAIDRAAKRAGLTDVTWHTLRHTFASQLVMRGVPLRAVQELLGHASIKMTERYAHLAPGFANRALVAVLDIPLAPPTETPMLPEGSDSDRDPKPDNPPKARSIKRQRTGSQGAAKASRRRRRTPRKDS